MEQSRSRSNSMTPQPSNSDDIPPELAPIVTLLSAQAHRRYNEGIFMLLQSINSDGEPIPNRKWREVYGVLLGTQLAVWDVEELERHQNNTEALMNASSKPDYINFTDSSFRAVDKLENSQGLRNIIIVSTTLKNQYLLQYQELEDFHRWNSAFRLATFEYTSLQEAYTGALLSARGSKLSDIRTILSESKFDYEDWVSVRFGSGMPWKRCFAVIEQPKKKSKSKIYKGSVSFYKDEKKQKKTAMAIIKDASAAYALYPQSHKLIDHSTMIKLEGTVFFDGSKKSLPKEACVYFMPEQHSAVPGYDTLIRFLIPLLDTFALYGRPKRLNANKSELNSLLFGLPVLPHVHYLDVDDLILLASSPQSSNWLLTEWRSKIKEVLGRKLASGYTGCGSNHGIVGAISSPAFNTNDFLDPNAHSGPNRPISPLSPSFFPAPKFKNRDSMYSKNSSLNESGGESSEPSSPPKNPNLNRNSEISQIYEDYSNVAHMNDGTMSRYNKSSENVNQQQRVKQFTKGIGYNTTDAQGTQSVPSGGRNGSNSRLDDPYVPISRNLQHNNGSQGSLNSRNTGGNNDPYSNFKNSTSQQRLYLDDDDDDDFEEDFNKGISALSIGGDDVHGNGSKPSINSNRSDDIFNPDYNARSTEEPALKVQTPSKPLPLPNIKIEQVSPYTSGRINSASPTTTHAPEFPINPQQPPSNPYQKSGVVKSPAQRFQPLNQGGPMPPQHQPQGQPVQSQQRSQYPPQQLPQPQPQGPNYGYPHQQSQPQQRGPPPHQQQYRGPPPIQQSQQVPPQQRSGGYPPVSHQQPQSRPQQQYPPVQQGRPPVQQGRPPAQQYQGHPPPQSQPQRRGPPPVQQQGYPPVQQHYGPPPNQQTRPIPSSTSMGSIPRTQGYPPQQVPHPAHGQFPQRKPVNVNPYSTGAPSGNPYAQSNPYAR